jgi:hypothetical protein
MYPTIIVHVMVCTSVGQTLVVAKACSTGAVRMAHASQMTQVWEELSYHSNLAWSCGDSLPCLSSKVRA